MAAAGFSKVLFNAFEQAISGDLNRISDLSSRELQAVLKGLMGRDDLFGINSFVAQPGPSSAETPIEGCYDLASYGTSSSSLTVSVSFGTGFVDPEVSTTADESDWAVVRWNGADLTVIPDPTNPRAAIIVATPDVVGTDPVNRNILIDPVTRTVQTQVVNKTANPSASLQIIHGTPGPYLQNGAGPLPPVVPSGSLLLFEVFIPAAALNGAQCEMIRRTPRMSVGVLNNFHGLLQGSFSFGFSGDESLSNVGPRTVSGAPLRAIIDGELVQSTQIIDAIVDSNSGNNPFNVAAPAGNDKPYFVYLCGGRHLPQWQGRGGAPAFPGPQAPFVLIASLVPPNSFGYPTANIGTPRGQTKQAALYVGIGFVIQGSTRNKAVTWSGDFVYAASGGSQEIPIPSNALNPICFNETALAPAVNTPLTITGLSSKPSVSTRARCIMAWGFTGAVTSNFASIRLELNSGGTRQTVAASTLPILAGGSHYDLKVFELPHLSSGPPMFNFNLQDPTAAITNQRLLVAATAFNMGAPRLA